MNTPTTETTDKKQTKSPTHVVGRERQAANTGQISDIRLGNRRFDMCYTDALTWRKTSAHSALSNAPFAGLTASSALRNVSLMTDQPMELWFGYFCMVLPRTLQIGPCVTIFVYNFIIDRVRHSIHLFYLEQIDLEQSPSFTHIWYRGAVYLWKGSRP